MTITLIRPSVGRSVLVASLAVALTAATAISPSTVQAVAAVPAEVQSGGDWYPQDLAPLGFSDGGKGALLPVYGESVVTPDQGLAVSVQPWLKLPDGPDGQITFTVSTPGPNNPKSLWSGSTASAKVRIPDGVLESGRTYLWQAQSLGGDSFGPYAMQVDVRRTGVQPNQAFGPFSVDLASGAVAVGAGLRPLHGASGALGIQLTHRSEDISDPGLPSGWQVTAQGQAWDRVQVNDDGSVEMVSVSGVHTAFVPTSGGAFQPRLAAGRDQATGSTPTLARNDDGSFTSTMLSGQVAVFGVPNDDGIGYLKQTFNGTVAGPRYDLTDGKITSVRDGIDNDFGLSVKYQGVDGFDCAKPATGFDSVPDEMMCEIQYPDGSTTSMSYVSVGGSPVLARITDFPDLRESDVKASVVDYRYDQAARVIAVRGAAEAAAQASGVRTDADALVAEVTYDDAGRADTVTKSAASQGDQRPTYTLDYEPDFTAQKGRTAISQQGRDTTSGFVSRFDYDSSTLHTLVNTGPNGRSSTTEWAASADQVSHTENSYGVQVVNEYDEQGRLASTAGPFVGDAPNGSTARQVYAYDQEVKADQPVDQAKDLHGFHVTYWTNDTLTDIPQSSDLVRAWKVTCRTRRNGIGMRPLMVVMVRGVRASTVL